jgi:anti-sigma-K factor RskA
VDRSPHSDRLADLAPLFAIGVLDGPDRDDFAVHILSGCPRCERSVRGWHRVLSGLAWTVFEGSPAASGPRRLRSAAASDAVRGVPPRGRNPGKWLALAATVLLALAGLDDAARRRELAQAARLRVRLPAENFRRREEIAGQALRARFLEDPDIQAISLTGPAHRPGARGRVVFSPRARRAIFLSAALAPLGAKRQYELWFLSGGKVIPAGTFDPSERNATVFESAPVPEGIAVEKFAVSIEPRGGVPQPTGTIVMAGGIQEES